MTAPHQPHLRAGAAAGMPATSAAGRPTLRRAFRAELLKASTLRSTWLTLAAGVLVAIGIAALLTARTAAQWPTLPPAERAGLDPLEDALLGVYLWQIVVGAFGVLVSSSEYATGTIATTLAAVTRRRHVVLAKVLVVALLVGVVGAVTVVACLALGRVLLPPELAIALDATTLRVVAGNVTSMVAVGLVGAALGILTRSTAAALSILLVVMVLPAIVVAAPELTTYLPARVAQALMLREASPASHLLDPGPALLVLGAYVATVVAAAHLALRSRDA